LTQAGVVTNNADVPRRLAAVGLSLAVLLATQSAPLVHTHPDDDATDHHHAFEVHAHYEGHPTAARPLDESVVDHPDDNDRAVFVRLFVGVVTAGFDLPAAVPALFDVSKPGERRSLRALYGFHGHDPPPVPSRSPRAPPAFLS
jgi:hypothetical protein